MRDCVGAPDERLEEAELRVTELEEMLEKAERDNFSLQ